MVGIILVVKRKRRVMSKKLPLYVEVKVKMDAMAEETGMPVAAIAATGICEMVKDRPFGVKELARVNEIVEENIKKRDQRKLRKGAF